MSSSLLCVVSVTLKPYPNGNYQNQLQSLRIVVYYQNQLNRLRTEVERLTDALLTVKEAAPLLRTTEKGLRWMIHQGTAPKSALVGGTRRMFRQSDIDAYIAEAFEDVK